MQGKMRGNEYRTTVVCVDTYEKQIPIGRLYNPSCEGTQFHGLMDFLLKMEELLDGMQFPQSFTAVRTFASPPERTRGAPPGEEPQEGGRGTFAVRVIFRQNASWQGSVTWLEGGREESFRSVLELVLLMDSALSGTDGKGEKRAAASPACGA